MTDPSEIAEFYDDYGEQEWERLDRDFHHRLEFEVTTDYLTDHLPETGHILDVGGGGGRYAVWLAERGYDVTLVDVSERQVEIASEKAAEHGVTDRVETQQGDVRSLAFDDAQFDATLCLGGALSHVLDADERETAVTELRRVTHSNSPVFVSVMGLLASVTRMLRHAGKTEPDETELLPDLVATGDYDRKLVERYGRELSIQPMHLFRADEFETLLAGELTVETLAALEGPFSQRRDRQDALTATHRSAIRETLATLREDRSVVDHSAHMLAVCRT
ncbi:class I SAM-dependent methyltransferase [Halobacteriales archaeon SW_8_65_20]|nr:MAG: class I SAM-dependent methyltransferase [Halobacteriales archaeon SW_8_65_20]